MIFDKQSQQKEQTKKENCASSEARPLNLKRKLHQSCSIIWYKRVRNSAILQN